MGKRQRVRVTVFYGERYGGDGWPPEELPAFMAWFAAIINEIPVQFRDQTTVRINSESGYEGDHSPSIDIEYYRDETDEEMAEREREAADERKAKETEERQTLQRLAKKYGTPTPPQSL